jgi:hypothetical protein
MALALAVLSLSQAALRVAATIAPSGLERVIVALPIGVATAALALLPSPVVAVLTELAAWWRRLHPPARLAAAALCGSSAAWLTWQLRNPSIGFDSALCHYLFEGGGAVNRRASAPGR